MIPARFEGLDPYDALRGARVPNWVRRNARARQAVIQLRKRLPVDISPVLAVQPFVMAKAVACFLTAEARLATIGRDGGRRDELVDALFSSGGCLGEGRWGYEFDVQTRWAYYPAGTPNLIATFFVGRALLTAGTVWRDERLISEGLAAADYVAGELCVWGADGQPVFRYTPTTDAIVHNANLLGAGLVAASGCLLRDGERIRLGRDAARLTLDAVDDGVVPYGVGRSLHWVDNFHTAYDLDGLQLVRLAEGPADYDERVVSVARAWEEHFFGRNGEPRYYLDGSGPFDIHSAATGVDVACRLAADGLVSPELPQRVAAWTRANLVDSETGRTFYRRGRWFTDRRSFVRWGDAHWALGEAALALMEAGATDPLAARLNGRALSE